MAECEPAARGAKYPAYASRELPNTGGSSRPGARLYGLSEERDPVQFVFDL